MWLFNKLELSQVTSSGLENIDPTQSSIFVVTHLSNYDITAALESIYRFSPYIKLGLAQQFINSFTSLNLFPITRIPQTAGKAYESHRYELADYAVMAQAMLERSLSIVIAGHRPSLLKRGLPRHPCIGVVALASLTNAPIIPTVVTIACPDESLLFRNVIHSFWTGLILRQTYPAHVTFCPPITLEPAPLDYLKVLNRPALSYLIGQGNIIMSAFAQQLPPHLQGKWKDRV